MLMLFQGGRLVGYCFGVEPNPLRVEVMAPNPFDLSRNEQGIVLLCLVLSAVCIYAPCRWKFRPIPPPESRTASRYLPYLCLLFALALPIQLFKNYRYYDYVQQHGGYLAIFVNHAALAASVPFIVRLIPLISLPVFVAVFVIERRKWLLYLATVIYFASASVILLLGSRMTAFLLVLALWYVARIKSVGKTRVLRVVALGLVLLLVGDAVRQLRESSDATLQGIDSPISVLSLQGVSLNVTEVVVKFRSHFAPYAGSYLRRELQDAFIANDTAGYYRGQALGFDVTVLLLPAMFSQGYGTAASYLAEAYVIGGVAGVLIISVLIGFGLHLLHRLSGQPLSLFLVAMILPDVLLMPRGALLDWLSVLMRTAISIALLWFGWKIYSLLLSVRRSSPSAKASAMMEA